MAQHGVDMGRDLHPILRPDVAATPEVIGGDVVRRALAALDRGQDVDRGGGAGPGGHREIK